jgi:hypothetical protein
MVSPAWTASLGFGAGLALGAGVVADDFVVADGSTVGGDGWGIFGTGGAAELGVAWIRGSGAAGVAATLAITSAVVAFSLFMASKA